MLKRSTNNLTRTLPGIEPTGPRKVDRLPPDVLKRRRAAKRLLIDARHEKNALELIVKLPAAGESLHFVIDGRFEPCDLIPATRRLSHPATIAALTVTTLGFNADNVATIARGMDQGKVGNVTLICSHYFKKAEAGLYESAVKEIEGRGGRVFGLRTHTKLILMETTDGSYHTIEGSGNLRSCKSIEQFCWTNDKELYDFQRQWLEEYIAKTGKRKSG